MNPLLDLIEQGIHCHCLVKLIQHPHNSSRKLIEDELLIEFLDGPLKNTNLTYGIKGSEAYNKLFANAEKQRT